jgi:hypothetical protein
MTSREARGEIIREDANEQIWEALKMSGDDQAKLTEQPGGKVTDRIAHTDHRMAEISMKTKKTERK